MSNLTLSHFAVLVTVLAAAYCTSTQAGTVPQIPEIGHILHRLGPVGAQGWGESDVDGDGFADLITSTDGPAALILVYGRTAGSSQLRLKQTLVGRPDSVAALATTPVGDARVVAIGPDRVATLYGGWPLAAQGSFTVNHDAALARIGDIDADGVLELVCASADMLSVYTLPTGEFEWSVSLPIADVVLASLDADAALELVIAGGDDIPGVILDGATQIQEWFRAEGFGSYVVAVRFGEELQSGFVGARNWDSLSGFSAAPYTPSWSMDFHNVGAVAAGDTDADARDEFAVGHGQGAGIIVYDGPTQQVLHSLPNAGYGILALGFIDLDGDAREEVWYSAPIENSSDSEANFAAEIVNPITGQRRLTIESYWQGASATLLVDLNEDGQLDWIIGTSGTYSSLGLLRVFNAATLTEEWRAPYNRQNSYEHFQMGYHSLHVAQLDTDPALELVAIGGNRYIGFRFMVLDGASYAVEKQVPAVFQNIAGTVVASRLVQHVPGGNPELLVMSHRWDGINLHVYSLPDGVQLWSSPDLDVHVYPDRSHGLDVGQLDTDPAPEYLVVHSSGLSAFDGADGHAEWSLPTTAYGAIIVAKEGGNAIFAYTTEGQVTVYDVDTREPIDKFTLPAPMERLARLPDSDDLLLAVAGERLLLVHVTGEVLGQSDWIGGEPEVLGDNLHVVREGRHWRVSTGRSFATYQHLVKNPGVFGDGFE